MRKTVKLSKSEAVDNDFYRLYFQTSIEICCKLIHEEIIQNIIGNELSDSNEDSGQIFETKNIYKRTSKKLE